MTDNSNIDVLKHTPEGLRRILRPADNYARLPERQLNTAPAGPVLTADFIKSYDAMPARQAQEKYLSGADPTFNRLVDLLDAYRNPKSNTEVKS